MSSSYDIHPRLRSRSRSRSRSFDFLQNVPDDVQNLNDGISVGSYEYRSVGSYDENSFGDNIEPPSISFDDVFDFDY
jgi:hypothetical protein